MEAIERQDSPLLRPHPVNRARPAIVRHGKEPGSISAQQGSKVNGHPTSLAEARQRPGALMDQLDMAEAIL